MFDLAHRCLAVDAVFCFFLFLFGCAGLFGPQSSNELHAPDSRPESLVYLQSGLDHYENSEDDGFSTGPDEEELHAVYMTDEIQGASSDSSVQKTDDSGQRHPFELLLRDSQNSNHVEGVSFPTVKDFKHFVEILKSSYLIPGADLTRHFLTAREMIAKEARAQYAQAQLDAAAESAAVYGGSENEVYSEPPEAEPVEQMEQDGKYQAESKSSSFSDPVDSTPNLIFTSFRDVQGPPLSSSLIPRSSLQGFNGDAHESADDSLFASYKPFFTNGQNVQLEDEPYVQSEKLGREISAGTRTKPFNSYARSIKVSAPKTLFNISGYFPQRQNEKPTPSDERHQPQTGKTSKDVNERPTGRLQPSDSSASSKSNPFPSRRTSQGAPQSSSQHNSQNEVRGRKQPIASHYHTNNQDGYLEKPSPQNPTATYQEQRVHNYPTSKSAGQHSAKIHAYPPTMAVDTNFNTRRNFPLPASSQAALSRLLGNVATRRGFGFKNTSPSRSPAQGADPIKNMLVSFLNRRSRGPSLNRASVGSIHAGILQDFKRRSKLWNHPHGVSHRFGNMAYPWSASIFSEASSGRMSPNGGRNRPPFLWRGHHTPVSQKTWNSRVSRSDSVIGADPLHQETPGMSRWKPVLRPGRASTAH